MKPKFCIYPQPSYLTFRTAIEAKILFAVCLSKCGFWSGSVKTSPEKAPSSKKIGVESAVPILVYFYIIMINKYRQSAKTDLLLNLPLTGLLKIDMLDARREKKLTAGVLYIR